MSPVSVMKIFQRAVSQVRLDVLSAPPFNPSGPILALQNMPQEAAVCFKELILEVET